jgi:hypothetical protein
MGNIGSWSVDQLQSRGQGHPQADIANYVNLHGDPTGTRAILIPGRCGRHPCRTTRRAGHTGAYRPGSRAEPRSVQIITLKRERARRPLSEVE